MDSENFKIVGVSKSIVSIEILDPNQFDGQFSVGSYIKIPHDISGSKFIIGIISDYRVKNMSSDDPQVTELGPEFIIQVDLIGSYIKDTGGEYRFDRGSHGIPLPPNNGIELLNVTDFDNIFSCKLNSEERFVFSKLAQELDVNVPVNGNSFFNKHFAIIGSTGSGKSHVVANILQKAMIAKDSEFTGLNNSHIVLFDIHGEYSEAFNGANLIDHSTMKIPYWLFDSDELADLFIESSESNSHNQISQFRYAVTENKKVHNSDSDQSKIYFDSPVQFKIDEVIQYIKNINNEVVGKLEGEGVPKDSDGNLIPERLDRYFTESIEFCEQSSAAAKKASAGPYKGDFERFILRLETTVRNPRLSFLFDDVDQFSMEDVLRTLLGYKDSSKSNITVIDLSGIPFEVLSIIVSFITRMIFEFGYYYKKQMSGSDQCEAPILLVYEEAHKYVPRSDLVRYRASRSAIERVAKEGRKYGVTLGIVSQRPSEISETIFSQCNNFIAMRLTNPDDQNYVKRLLPDTLEGLTDSLSSLKSGEALIIGESIVLPSLVKIDFPDIAPSSADIPYFDEWKLQWKNVDIPSILESWSNKSS